MKYTEIKQTSKGVRVFLNLNDKPQYRATANEAECSEYKTNYNSWELSHVEVEFADEHQQNSVVKYVKRKYNDQTNSQWGFRFNEDLQNGIPVDCIDVRVVTCNNCNNQGGYLSPDCCGDFKQLAYFKQ